ncbi:MAG: hypothetical protein LBQ54_11360 [Planctomycetaceae bacterium]|nr:hypothetical protein [Planctomycetaceae bacterium]
MCLLARRERQRTGVASRMELPLRKPRTRSRWSLGSVPLHRSMPSASGGKIFHQRANRT